ncbi:hypothetical protein SAMN02745166_02401 [Prosthecobacter debontii]|uniref:Uncharacterized protein n=1 Tax=Prosthecobacter debontii TaxID=48467 RepID=A0A1T4Y4R5_9BACT|nr:hypothetical protein [Prosthecobacter debontii]SKA96508.1 hypothetical protein SAMN02745166_02401 [Prosthecobacter debontii]
MFRQISSIVSALIMALPMCWCCMVQAMPAAPQPEEAACPACHQDAAPAHTPATPAEKHCPCCVEMTPRDLSPDAVQAPRPLFSVQSLALWPSSMDTWLLPPHKQERDVHTWHPPQSGLPWHPPLYQQHCALLI